MMFGSTGGIKSKDHSQFGTTLMANLVSEFTVGLPRAQAGMGLRTY